MIHHLQSIDDPRLAPFRDLDRTNRTRHDDCFIGEGRLVVQRMLQSDFEMRSVVAGDNVSPSFLERVPDDIDLFRLSRERVSQLAGFDFHSGILGCAERRRMVALTGIEQQLSRPEATLVICPFTVLPDNLGSIARLSAGFGVDALVVGAQSADPFSRRALRVSMGNVLNLPVVEPADLESTLIQLKTGFGFCVIGATGHEGDLALPLERPAKRIALVLGNEAEGIPDPFLQLCDLRVTIPMSGATDSINVANAAAILLYQFLRVNGPGRS